MRCPTCNKFVSIEQQDPELSDLAVDAGGTVTGSVRMALLCMDCSEELSEATVDIEESIDIEHKAGCTEITDLEVSEESAESDDRFEGTGRYAKHFYGADITAKAKCPECGVEVDVSVHVEEQASAFESLV